MIMKTTPTPPPPPPPASNSLRTRASPYIQPHLLTTLLTNPTLNLLTINTHQIPSIFSPHFSDQEKERENGCSAFHLRHLRECYCSVPVSRTSVDVQENNKVPVNRGLLRHTLQHDVAELPAGGVVRPPLHLPQQHPGKHHKRCWSCVGAHLRSHLPDFRQTEDQGQDGHTAGACFHCLCRCRVGLASSASWEPQEDFLWVGVRDLLHRHVRVPTLHNEVGDKNKECGVHAVLPLALRVLVWNIMVHLRTSRARPFRLHPKWCWQCSGTGAAHSLRDIPEERSGRRWRGWTWRGEEAIKWNQWKCLKPIYFMFVFSDCNCQV